MMAKPQILKDLAEVVQKIIHKESKKDPEKRKWGKKKNKILSNSRFSLFYPRPPQN